MKPLAFVDCIYDAGGFFIAEKGVLDMPSSIKFGTDGWRAIIAEDFTFDNVRACAQSVASYLKRSKQSKKGIIIGYDTRFASEDFAAACAEVLAGNGVKVYLCTKPTPTPVISYSALVQKTAGAIIITASHNPAQWNGFKIKTAQGTSAPPEVTEELEKNIVRIQSGGKVQILPLTQARSNGLVVDIDLAPGYMDHLVELINLPRLRLASIPLVADAMFGAGMGYFNTLLQGAKTKVTEIHGERNPLFPGMHNPEPIARNLVELASAVKESRAMVGLATDGDADRLGVVDEQGQFLTPHQVFALLALYLLEVRGQRGAIIRTITSTTMLDRLGEIYGVPVMETSVGFKYVAPLMEAHNALIGGEESGGYGFRGHVLERDGILAGLYFLDWMVGMGKTPGQLIEYLYKKVGPHYYNRSDITLSPQQRDGIMDKISAKRLKSLAGLKVTRRDAPDGLRFHLADKSWLLIRASGTEPLLRIYAESSSPANVENLLAEGKNLVGV